MAGALAAAVTRLRARAAPAPAQWPVASELVLQGPRAPGRRSPRCSWCRACLSGLGGCARSLGASLRALVKWAGPGQEPPRSFSASLAPPLASLRSTPVSNLACAHLHVHSEYSLLDGACKIEALAAARRRVRAARPRADRPRGDERRRRALQGLRQARDQADRRLRDLSGRRSHAPPRRPARGRVERNHLTLLAANDAGYRNLVKLSSAGFLEGLHRGKPTVDLEQIERHAEGVIALTGCLASRFCQRLPKTAPRTRAPTPTSCCAIFGPENVYFELQKNGLAAQEKCNEGIVRIAREMGGSWSAPATSTTCAARTTTTTPRCCACRPRARWPQPKMTFETNEFYLRDSAEMVDAFAQWPEAIANTLEIAERCSVRARARQAADPELPDPRRGARARVPAARVQEGLRAALRRPAARRRRWSGWRWSSA